MKKDVEITKIGDVKFDPPIFLPFTVRGYHKGKKAKPTKCAYCDGVIEIGEQYFRFGGESATPYCLGCVEYI